MDKYRWQHCTTCHRDFRSRRIRIRKNGELGYRKTCTACLRRRRLAKEALGAPVYRWRGRPKGVTK